MWWDGIYFRLVAGAFCFFHGWRRTLLSSCSVANWLLVSASCQVDPTEASSYTSLSIVEQPAPVTRNRHQSVRLQGWSSSH